MNQKGLNFIGNLNLWAKGVAETTIYDENGNTRAYLKDMTSSQFTGDINLGEIRTGVGLPIAMQIPDSPNYKIEFVNDSFSPEINAMQVGAEISRVGKVPTRESVTLVANGAKGAKGYIMGIPVTRLGSNDLTPIGTVFKYNGKYVKDTNAVTFKFDEATGMYEFEIEDGKANDIVCIEYTIDKAGAYEYGVSAISSPFIGRAVTKFVLYSSDPSKDPAKGSLAGYMYVTVPKGQFTPAFNIGGNQNEHTKTNASFVALPNDSTDLSSCQATFNKLVYITIEFLGDDWTEYASSMVLMPASLTLGNGETGKVLVKAIVDGQLVNVSDYAKNLTFTPDSEAEEFTVDENGIVKADATKTGTHNITVTPNASLINANNLTGTVEVIVE